MGSTRIFVLGFLAIILLGTLLLMLPISSADGEPTNPLNAAFTAVSATCVTGLTVVDTATHWSMFGQIVILLMIQVGGLGFMTLAVMLSLLIRRSVTPRERMLVAMSYNLGSYDSTLVLVRRILIGTVCMEGVGALLLSIRFIPDFGLANGIYKSIFHSVSAFCNAGFDIIGIGNPNISGMGYYVGDYLVNVTLALLIIFGGIGFLVWSDMINFTRSGKRLSVYSKFVLIITAVLLVSGTVFFAVFEWSNPLTLGALDSIPKKILASFFQSTTWRTAGFAMIDNAAFTQNSQLLGILLMFIGGASGSTAGGVKVGTIGIVVYTVWCITIGKKNAVVFRRTIPESSFVRATAVIIVQLSVAVLGVLIMLSTTPFGTMDVLYESVSAIGTVGVSLGITPLLPGAGKVTLMFLMYFGRIGVLTFTYALMNSLSSESSSSIKYPDAKMPIG